MNPMSTTDPRPVRPRSGSHAFVWGDNHHGGLGLGSTARVSTPRPAFLPADLTMVAAGVGFTVGVTSEGAVWSWGSNDFGQLGDGTTTARLHPVRARMPARMRVRMVFTGRQHTLALTDEGTVFAWGRNTFGQLGDGTVADRLLPVRVEIAGPVLHLAAGDAHSLAVVRGNMLAWGGLSTAQSTGTATPARTPTALALARGVIPVRAAAGARVSAVLDAKGVVRIWGRRFGTPERPTVLPRKAFAVDAGDDQVIALNTDGSITSIGLNSSGELGDGSTTIRSSPATWRLPRGARAVSVGVAGDHAVVLAFDGRVFGWGGNRSGYLGDGTTENRLSPVELPGVTGVTPRWLAVGYHHNLLLVQHGPAARLRVSTSGGRGRRPVKVTVDFTDAFGVLLGPVSGATITVNGKKIIGNSFIPPAAGRYLVAAATAALRGWTHVEVR